jgi:nicotinamidase-related amidase
MKTALLLIDIQNDYFANGAMPLVGAEEAAQKASQVLNHFRAKKLPVFHIQHIAMRPTATFFLPCTFGVGIHAAVQPVDNESVIVKHFPNSFRETELLDQLKSLNINHLVIAGMMTHMCVDATVRAAKDLGFEITLLGDACATRDLEVNGNKVVANDVHHSFLAALSYFYAEVTTCEKYLATDL